MPFETSAFTGQFFEFLVHDFSQISYKEHIAHWTLSSLVTLGPIALLVLHQYSAGRSKILHGPPTPIFLNQSDEFRIGSAESPCEFGLVQRVG